MKISLGSVAESFPPIPAGVMLWAHTEVEKLFVSEPVASTSVTVEPID
jgi:hypothetical protein